MKKLCIISLCISIMLLFAGCSNSDDNNINSSIINDATIAGENHSHEQENHPSDVLSEEIFDTPVDLVEFSNIDDFSAYLLSAEKNEDMADLASLTYYFLPTGIPEGYKLYKITAGVSDIGFWYLPDEFLSSTDATLDAEALQKHFLFISTRDTYEFGSVMAQFEATQDDLIDGRYLLRDGSEKLVIWEQNGATLMMYLPTNYDVDVANIHTLCETEQYTKNARTGVFECVQE